MQMTSYERYATLKSIVVGSVNPALPTVLNDDLAIDVDYPTRSPIWEMVFKVESLDARILGHISCEPCLETEIVITSRPEVVSLWGRFYDLSRSVFYAV